MVQILAAIGMMVVSGVGAFLSGRNHRLSRTVGVGGLVAGCVLALPAALHTMVTGHALSFRWQWTVPFGSFFVRMDPLSAVFLFPILLLAAVAAVYGAGYLGVNGHGKKTGSHFFFYNLLVASMVMVTVAANGILFLFAWEIMSLASFFLVTFEDDRPSVRNAGWIYLVATHLGGALILVLFLLFGTTSEAFDFDTFSRLKDVSPDLVAPVFLLAVVGFGAKAGFIPFHVWLPEAHPAAPSHVSALMSGAMIKTGIYGIFRVLTFLGTPPPWWGWLLLTLGGLSGLFGVMMALAQHDLKRLLAYHSVENIGIICMGMGMGLLGLSMDRPLMAVLGFSGALLHVVNHALFKGLLFMASGAVVSAAGTREIDRLGGLVKRMPETAVLFLLGAAAICGLPPLNGFVSEFLIYLGAYHGSGFAAFSIAGIGTIAVLAVIGGLAVACFTKAFGIVFQGEPRTREAADSREVGRLMRAAMWVPAAGCVLIGLGAPFVMAAMGPVIETATGYDREAIAGHLLMATQTLSGLAVVLVTGLSILALLLIWRYFLFSGRTTRESGTWDCGYLAPGARMQYTASSFAMPLTRMFQIFIRTRRREEPVEGLFPHHASLATEPGDLFRERLFDPLFRGIEKRLLKWHGLQQGRVQVYILYVAATLFGLLVWSFK